MRQSCVNAKREEDEEDEEDQDTESKTRTPHKVVGNYSMCFSYLRITATFYVEYLFAKFILKPVSALSSPICFGYSCD